MRTSSFQFEERQPREERAGPPRLSSRDGDMYNHSPSQYPSPPFGYDRPPVKEAFAPPQSSRSHLGYPTQSNYHYQRHPQTRHPRGLQAVVTSSFSEEETMRHRIMAAEERYESHGHEREREGVEQREEAYYQDYDRTAANNTHHHHFPPPASRRHHQYIQKSFSTGYQANDGPLKRSYYHHSHPNEGHGQLPADFMPPALPPKRVKLESAQARGEIVIAPRHHSQVEWYSQGSWEAEQDPYSRLNRRQSRSFPPSQAWTHQQQRSPSGSPIRNEHEMEHARSKMPPIDETEYPSRAWQSPAGLHWNSSSTRAPPPASHNHRYWDRNQEEHVSRVPRVSLDGHQQQTLYPTRNNAADKMQLVVDAAAATGDHKPTEEKLDGLFLLALPQDRVSLSETLCVVRENIEVFTATQADVDAPAPGRKHAVVVGQVGLRCIHCRHTTKCSDRVKRAVCYPSSIKRIYRTVIDMKLDHFSQCKFVPDSLKFKLQQLKSVQTRSTGTTMQYFIRAAVALGMEDGPSGVRLVKGKISGDADVKGSLGFVEDAPKNDEKGPPTSLIIHRTDSTGSGQSETSKANDSMISTESFDSSGGGPSSVVSLDKYYDGCIPLALPEDQNNLSPLRCFLRQQVCAFSATEEDIAVRASTTVSVSVGQVGIGCIHCVSCPPKERSNRAMCFPFSIGRIYQSVADIQRFHFVECTNLPSDVKEKFLELQSASSKGSKGLATRQYWVSSARKIGLVDTSRGIRFGRDPTKPEETKSFSLDILAQAAFSVTTADRPLVVPEDKEAIAEFLYVVMEQLQPCRFTEADRNKRRLKDVGCIGVECKHCAGQVDSRKFFWSSVNAVESNFVSVHTHMLECRMVPDSLKEELIHLKSLRKEQTVALRTGSQKAFFARVWQRLHDDEESRLSGATDLPLGCARYTSREDEEVRDDTPSCERDATASDEKTDNVVSV